LANYKHHTKLFSLFIIKSKSNIKKGSQTISNFVSKTSFSPKSEDKEINMAEAQAATLQNIFETLTKVTNELKDKPTNRELTVAMKALQNCVEHLAHIVQKEQDKEKTLETTIKEHEDEIDHLKQKSLKGRIIITSKSQYGQCNIKTDDQLRQENKSLADHLTELVKLKYGQDIITEGSIQTCFRLKKGGILVKFWKNGKGSPFQTLSTKIKSAQESDINLYFNFMLTSRRGELLFKIRKMKKEGKIAKFYSDEDGSISIQIARGERKIKVTDTILEGTNKIKTWTVDEVAAACS